MQKVQALFLSYIYARARALCALERAWESGCKFGNIPLLSRLLFIHISEMEAQQKPEGLKRIQAGVKPLQKAKVTLAPTGRQDALPPFQGLATSRLFAGVPPLPVVSTPLRGYPLGNVYKE